jgi:hypothetical protein
MPQQARAAPSPPSTERHHGHESGGDAAHRPFSEEDVEVEALSAREQSRNVALAVEQ